MEISPPLHAPRAGTRGFRAPEILWKDSHQTTGFFFLIFLISHYFHANQLLLEISC